MSDLISRQALLEEYDRLHVGEPGRARKMIEDAPPAQPDWIPCSERLPEANGRYLVTRGLDVCGGAIWNRVYIINHSDLMGLKSERIWWCGNVGKSDFEHINDVIAWMPLPEPYREEK